MSRTEHSEKLIRGALWYGSHDWRILPCHGMDDSGRCTCNRPHAEPKDVGKHPAVGEWNVRATSDATTINGWWDTNNNYNIGVFCQPSGFFVIDVDPRSGGVESFEKFEELLHGALPNTVMAYTGVYQHKGKAVRGRHIFYRIEDGEQLQGNLKAQGLDGIDIKHNGYVMLAPSRHGSGVNYEWVEGHAPWEIEMAKAPEELLAALRKKSRRSSTSLGETDWSFMSDLEYKGDKIDIAKMLEEGIEEGSRAVDIYKLACALANKNGVETPEKRLMIETMMMRFNFEKVKPPMELEGPNSLLMHVRRAMDFVAENPIGDRIWPGAQDWAKRNQEESRSARATATTSTPSVAPVSRSTSTITSLSDSDSLIGSASLPGTIGGAVVEAARSGMSIDEAFSSGNVDIPLDPDAISEAEGGTPGRRTLSDLGNGRRLVDSFGSSIRYTPGIGWFIWDGSYWRPDAEDLGMKEMAKRLPPIIASEVLNYEDQDKKNEVLKWANQAKSNSRLSSTIESANSDTRVVVPVESWDGNSYLLGVQNGVIDLRTGELIKGEPSLYITKRSPVAYTQGMKNVRWEQFIDFATGGDKELQNWIQLAAGYSLTGLRTQDVMFLVYGPPGSGKNTFVEALVKAMGTSQYAWPLDSSILAQGDGQSSSTDLYHWAELRGKRMVWVDELPESERMKENAVKKLTGSSEISARSPGEKPFTFESQAKLWVTTNHRPMINDDAMWRRIRPIPWSNVPEVADPDLKAYLFDPEGALPAVLSWAVEGAIKYLGSQKRDPLEMCSAVKEAADIYRKNEDRIGMFLDEESKESEEGTVGVKTLYVLYRMWSEERGERPMTQIAFHRKLADRGLKIEGQGTRAQILGRITMPRAVPNGEVDWQTATRFAKSI
jgi:P4 family phage/plasmid primase-like protien